jgi:UPF0755 protein
MSDIGILGDPDDEQAHEERRTPAGGRRAEKQRRRGPGCLIALVILAVLVGGGYFAVREGMQRIEDAFSDPEDYPGPGTGSVTFEVKSGDTVTEMGRNLKAEGVVASVDAFINAASANGDSSNIQVGFYPMLEKMPAADAVAVLVDPSNIETTAVAIPEGQQVREIVDRLVEASGIKRAEFEAALKDPAALGLPDYAGGNPEGYLFPATYAFPPNATAADMLKQMVARWQQAATDNDLEAKAAELGYTPNEVMTVASLVQAEGRGDDMPKVARVIYNRVENPSNGETNGLLQIDAAVNYALGQSGTTVITNEQKESVADSPYNTYTQKGLPPTPVEAPGDDAIQAALNPAEGDWLYYVTVNLETGETKFADDYETFLTYRNEYQDYCANESDRC